MKKSNLKIDQFKDAQLPRAQQLASTGGHTKIRRPGSTVVVAIWDDTEIRHPDAPEVVSDMTLRIFRP